MFIGTTPHGRHSLEFNSLRLLAKWHTVNAQTMWVCWPSSSPFISKVPEAPRCWKDASRCMSRTTSVWAEHSNPRTQREIRNPSLCKLLSKRRACLWCQLALSIFSYVETNIHAQNMFSDFWFFFLCLNLVSLWMVNNVIRYRLFFKESCFWSFRH